MYNKNTQYKQPHNTLKARNTTHTIPKQTKHTKHTQFRNHNTKQKQNTNEAHYDKQIQDVFKHHNTKQHCTNTTLQHNENKHTLNTQYNTRPTTAQHNQNTISTNTTLNKNKTPTTHNTTEHNAFFTKKTQY